MVPGLVFYGLWMRYVTIGLVGVWLVLHLGEIPSGHRFQRQGHPRSFSSSGRTPFYTSNHDLYFVYVSLLVGPIHCTALAKGQVCFSRCSDENPDFYEIKLSR